MNTAHSHHAALLVDVLAQLTSSSTAPLSLVMAYLYVMGKHCRGTETYMRHVCSSAFPHYRSRDKDRG